MSELEVGGILIRVNRKAIKNLHLSVYPPDGRVHIACPQSTTDETLRLYAASKLGWIKRQQKLLRGKVRQSERNYVTGETHYLLGKAYRLKVVETYGKAIIERKGKTQLTMHVPPTTTREAKATLLKEYYREELKPILEKMIHDWSSRMQVHPTRWRVQSMKTKWGSCNANTGSLLFNLELAKKPKSCIEYIVVHELVHLKERLHTDQFLAHMNRYLPMWRSRKEALNALPVGEMG